MAGSKKVKQETKPEKTAEENQTHSDSNGHSAQTNGTRVQQVFNRLTPEWSYGWLKTMVTTKFTKLFLGLLVAIVVLGVVQVGLLIWNGVAITRYSKQAAAEWQSTQMRTAMANRPLLSAEPKAFVCPDQTAMRELALSGINDTVCTFTLALTNRSSVYTADAALFEELVVVAEGREFERLAGIDYEIKEFIVQPGATTVLEIPFVMTTKELGPESEQDLVQIHVQIAHLAPEKSPVAGEYWYRYHWQYSPSGFTLKSSESKIPEINTAALGI